MSISTRPAHVTVRLDALVTRPAKMVALLAAAVAGAGGCGEVTVDPGLGGARGDSAVPAVAAACDRDKPFGAPVAVEAFNSDANDDGLSFSSDGLAAYISSARAGGLNNFDLFRLTRTSIDQPFGAAAPVDGGVNTLDQERDPRISRDGLRLYYFSNHLPVNAFDLFVATRPNPSGWFGAGTPLTRLNSALNEYNPFLAEGDQVVYFASDRPGGLGGTDIYKASLAAGASPEPPSLVTGVSSTASEYRPVVSEDGLTLYFDRAAAATGAGASATADDIWVATRAAASDPFGADHPVTELNEAGVDFPLWLSSDGCTLYFGSDRPSRMAGRIGWDIYQATRAR